MRIIKEKYDAIMKNVHASLSVGTVLIQKVTGAVVYESDYENETRVQFRTCIEIEDY